MWVKFEVTPTCVRACGLSLHAISLCAISPYYIDVSGDAGDYTSVFASQYDRGTIVRSYSARSSSLQFKMVDPSCGGNVRGRAKRHTFAFSFRLEFLQRTAENNLVILNLYFRE